MVSTRDRVPAHTAAEINRTIQEEIDASHTHFRQHLKRIPQRLRELDKEWT